MRALLEHHRYVERVDARLYGLPEDDFDDQKSISIAERLMLRRLAAEQNLDWPVTGPFQYPREILHGLRQLEQRSGTLTDCAAHPRGAGGGPRGPHPRLGAEGLDQQPA